MAVVRSVQQILSTAQRFNIPCWLALSSWSEAWAEVAIESGVTGLMVERDTVMAAAQTIDRIEAGDRPAIPKSKNSAVEIVDSQFYSNGTKGADRLR